MGYKEDLEAALKKVQEIEDKHQKKIIKLLEKYCGKITDLKKFEDYLKQYGDYIKKTQTQTEADTEGK